MTAPSRRRFLRSAGVALALPALDAFLPRLAFGRAPEPPRRFVAVCATLGLHGPNLFPAEAGRDYQSTPYLDALSAHRDALTVVSGLCHAEQSGADGHTSGLTWLTAARHPGLSGFRNTVSIDQHAVERLTPDTRFPSLALSTSGTGLSWSRNGVAVPAEESPAKLFGKLFLDGSAAEVKAQSQRLRDGRSILDDLRSQAAQLGPKLSRADRDKLDEYSTSVRELERRLHAAEAWAKRPKPKVPVAPPKDIANRADLIGRLALLYDLTHLALQTDSTRFVTLMVQGTNSVPPLDGVTEDHHNLSHHGKDPQKIEQLTKIETAEMRAFGDFLGKLAGSREAGGRLLDRTSVLFGSNLGNASSHDTKNLPLVVAGGGFRHGQHLKFDPATAPPFSNLFVSLLQRLGVETDRFAAGTKPLAGLEMAG